LRLIETIAFLLGVEKAFEFDACFDALIKKLPKQSMYENFLQNFPQFPQISLLQKFPENLQIHSFQINHQTHIF
jgi:hypothetical protein